MLDLGTRNSEAFGGAHAGKGGRGQAERQEDKCENSADYHFQLDSHPLPGRFSGVSNRRKGTFGD